MRSFVLIMIILGFWRSAFAGSVEPLRIQDSMEGTPAGPAMDYLFDAEGQYTVASIDAAPARVWTPLNQAFRNFGHRHATLWLRFHVRHSAAQPRIFYLENNYALTDRITVIAPDGSIQTLGDRESHAERAVPYRHPVFALTAVTGDQIFYIRMESAELLTVSYKVWDPQSFASMMNLESLLIGLLFGITVALLSYNCILYVMTRIALLRSYCFYLLCFILTEFCLIGISQLVVADKGPGVWLANEGFRLFLTLGIFAALSFMRLFLNLSELRPRLDQITQGLRLGLTLLFSYQIAGGPEANLLVSAFLSAASLHFMVATLTIVRDGYRPARILLIAWTLIVAGSGIASLSDLGLLNLDMGFILILHFAAGCVEMILLSLAIGEWWREERQRRRIEAARDEAVRIAIQSKQDHAFDQLKKIIYPHQLEQIMDGQQLEHTMPVGKGTAAVIAFDIVSSSRVDHDAIQEFLRSLFAECHAAMMKGYQPGSLHARAYRIKETGDGFLCSIGYPFRTLGEQSIPEAAVALAQEFVAIFHEQLQRVPALGALTCCCGVAMDRVESFFPKEGVKVYDLYGRAIVLATRYEALRKDIRMLAPEASTIIVQELVIQGLPQALRGQFQEMNLKALGIKVRDDADASVAFVQIVPSVI